MYTLIINTRDGKSFEVECKTPEEIAEKANTIQKHGFIADSDNEFYEPVEILSTVCPELIRS